MILFIPSNYSYFNRKERVSEINAKINVIYRDVLKKFNLIESFLRHDINNHAFYASGISEYLIKHAALHEDILKEIEDLTKTKGYESFEIDAKIDSKDTSRNLRAELEINYKDSTGAWDTVFIKNDKKEKWESYKLVIRTDSLKKPVMVKARLFEQDNKKNAPILDVRRISIRQYAPDKDTSKLFYLPVRPEDDKPQNKKTNKKPPTTKKINPKKNKPKSGLKVVK
ncbi:MAG: hypothetical protein HC831_26995 [Chloroflexia bacterium]|nr:hypothetical protein [Chloroflexia bacterium]